MKVERTYNEQKQGEKEREKKRDVKENNYYSQQKKDFKQKPGRLGFKSRKREENIKN